MDAAAAAAHAEKVDILQKKKGGRRGFATFCCLAPAKVQIAGKEQFVRRENEGFRQAYEKALEALMSNETDEMNRKKRFGFAIFTESKI